MLKPELMRILRPLLTEFDKEFSEEKWEIWFGELKTFHENQIQDAVRHFLNSDMQKTFPRIGEFKTAITGTGQRRTPQGTHHEPPSCDRCHHGIATVIRYQSSRKHSFAFRCSCSSGLHYPGFPLVSDDEQTLKESRSASRPIPFPEPSQWDKRRIVDEHLDYIPF